MKLKEFELKKDEFLTHLTLEKNLSPHTRSAYSLDLEQFIHFWQQIHEKEKKEIPLKRALDRYFIAIFNKKISSSSIARKVSCFKSFEKFLETKGIDVKFQLVRPHLEKKLPVYLTVDEIFHLLDQVNEQILPTKQPCRELAILELLYATGIRCSELIGIKLADIDWDQKTIRIYGKGNKERFVLFGSKAKERMFAYLQKERPYPQHINEHLLLNNRNEPLSSRSIQRTLAMFRKFLQIERPITPHKIRHSFATHLLNQGVDIRFVQELLGHKTLASTEKYTHVTTTQLAQLCNTLHPFNTMTTNNETNNTSSSDNQKD